MSFGNFEEIDVPQSLQKLNITKLGRENQKFFIQYEFQSNDGQPLPVLVNFDIKQEFGDTLEQFHKRASKRLQLTLELIQRTMVALANDEYCRKMLQFYDDDVNDVNDVNNDHTTNPTGTPQIGEPEASNNAIAESYLYSWKLQTPTVLSYMSQV